MMKQVQNKPEQHEQYVQEMHMLREELLSLKHCQITFLTFSVTATGILLGFGTLLGSSSHIVLSAVFLFPLVFLLPAWWIFFDKATTITRIVGYYRILEKLVLDMQYSVSNFTGWENSLREFRLLQGQGKLVCPSKQCKGFSLRVRDVFRLKAGHRYWLICYVIFFALSLLCIVVSLALAIVFRNWLFLGMAIFTSMIFAASAYSNLRMVHELIYGRSQYNCRECYWEQILGVPESKRVHSISPSSNS
jgi:hypothetical protein